VHYAQIKNAAEAFVSAALLGSGWGEALQYLADSADAGGASLVRVRTGRAVAQLSSTEWAENEADIMAGAPPNSLRFYPDHAYQRGFCVDHDVWTGEEIRADPYFQDFLRPRGVFFHAKARLHADRDERVTLTIKRRVEFGPYEPHEVAVLDSLLSEFQAAYRIAQRVLDSEASGMVRLIQDHEPVFELDSWGRVLRQHGNGSRFGLHVRAGQLVSTERLEQPALDRAVATASRSQPARGGLSGAQHPALVAITDARGARHFVQIIPVRGGARDVFRATAAIAAIVGRQQGARFPVRVIRESFGLTAREAQVAALLVDGFNLTEITERLGLGIGTTRNHLKKVFEKSGTRRQGELIALLAKLKC
jgi:DNA-binding CsgD family transcriptional regulator